MADRQAGLTGTNRVAVAGLLIFIVLTGCTEIAGHDVSKLLNIRYEVVTVKSSYDKINVRPTPSTAESPVATVRGGDKLNLYEERGDWLFVTFYDTAGSKQEGWVFKYLVDGYEKTGEARVEDTREDLSGFATPPSAASPVEEGNVPVSEEPPVEAGPAKKEGFSIL